MRIALSLLLVSTVCCAHAARADTFSHSRVPSSAEGVIHIDLDALRRSSMYGHLLSRLLGGNLNGLENKLKAGLTEKLGGDAEQEAKAEKIAGVVTKLIGTASGITVWLDKGEDGAMLVHAKARTDLVEAVASAAGATPETRRGVTFYHVDDSYMATQGSTIVLAQRAELVVRSVRVLQGKDKPLPKHRIDMRAKRPGIIFVAGFGGKVMDAIRKNAGATALRANILALSLHAGEDKGGVFITARAETDSAKTANKVAAILTGLSALVTLVEDEPALQALVSRINVSKAGKTVTATVEMPTKTLLSLIATID